MPVSKTVHVLLLQDLTSCCSTQPFVTMSCLEMQQLAKCLRASLVVALKGIYVRRTFNRLSKNIFCPKPNTRVQCSELVLAP
jgi:hypothetical protein